LLNRFKTLIILNSNLFTKIPVYCGLLTIFTLLYFGAFCQKSNKKIAYGPILDLPYRISGSFGEFRGNHFHAGLDFKTGEREGMPVYAPADGYVSRVKVSRGGYGRALYINHKDGITTVYGHLRAFYPQMEEAVLKKQNERSSYELEYFPRASEYPVKQGQVIGFTGNSGGSYGPHLHFETRNTKSEIPFDPVLQGYAFADTIPPLIETIVVFHPGPYGGLFGSRKYFIPVSTGALNEIPPIAITGDSVFIGVEVHDLAGSEPNPLGFKRLSLLANDKLIFETGIDSFSFGESKHISSVTDHAFYKQTGRTIILCHKLPGNPLRFWQSNGIIRMFANSPASCSLVVSDHAGNSGSFSFQLVCDTLIAPVLFDEKGFYLNIDDTLDWKGEDYHLFFRRGTFYEPVNIVINEVLTGDVRVASPVLSLGDPSMAINESVELNFSVRMNKELAEDTKKCLVRIDPGGTWSYIPLKREPLKVRALLTQTGQYGIVKDTIPPVIMDPVVTVDDWSGKEALIIPVMDNISGLDSWSCYFDGKWILSEYNSFRKEIRIEDFRSYTGNGSGSFLIKLTDSAGNISEISLITGP
jgi:hypothetical protein